MTRKSSIRARRLGFASTVALPLCLLVSACGGGGGSHVASIPPPPPPPPTPTPGQTLVVKTTWLPSPATQVGNYGVIGRLTLTPGSGDPTTYRATKPGEFTLKVSDPAGFDFLNYTLSAAAGILPGSLKSVSASSGTTSWDINLPPAPSFHYTNPYGDSTQYVGQNLSAYSKAEDGTETLFLSNDLTRGTTGSIQELTSTTQLRTTLDYDIGYSYVAMGEWSWRVVDLNGNPTPDGDFGDLLFVYGDRTPASGIPVSGTATYDAHSLALLGSNGTAGIPFTLTADFGDQTISTEIDQDYRYNSSDPAGDPILGIHVDGSAPFSNDGSFDIPLAGTVNYADTNASLTPPSEPVTGDMDGAFFGPHAEQVGGVFAVERQGGTLLMQDAFVGQQHPH